MDSPIETAFYCRLFRISENFFGWIFLRTLITKSVIRNDKSLIAVQAVIYFKLDYELFLLLKKWRIQYEEFQTRELNIFEDIDYKNVYRNLIIWNSKCKLTVEYYYLFEISKWSKNSGEYCYIYMNRFLSVLVTFSEVWNLKSETTRRKRKIILNKFTLKLKLV